MRFHILSVVLSLVWYPFINFATNNMCIINKFDKWPCLSDQNFPCKSSNPHDPGQIKKKIMLSYNLIIFIFFFLPLSNQLTTYLERPSFTILALTISKVTLWLASEVVIGDSTTPTSGISLSNPISLSANKNTNNTQRTARFMRSGRTFWVTLIGMED